MRIIFWSDFNCPNSYIGLHRLKQAVDELDIEVEWQMKPLNFTLHYFPLQQAP